MSSISVDSETKQEFDELKPADCTHSEFVEILLETYRMQDTELMLESLVDELSNEIEDSVATSAELAAYRGTKDAIESTVIRE